MLSFILFALTADPYRIFHDAQTYWLNQRYPSVVSYVVHVRTRMGRKIEHRHYDSTWAASENRVAVDPVSEEQRKNPYKPPPGFDVGVLGVKLGHIGGPNEGTGTKDDLIGIPVLAPNYSFGIAPYLPPADVTPAELVKEIRTEYHDPAPAKIAQLERETGLPTIATVVSAPPYTIKLAGIDAIDGHRDYHLVLTPQHEPHKYRLRDLWVDTQSYATDKLRSDGNFVDGGTSSVPWTVTFASVDGARYIASESTNAPMANWFDSVTVSFEQIAPGHLRPLQDLGTIGDSPIREP